MEMLEMLIMVDVENQIFHLLFQGKEVTPDMIHVEGATHEMIETAIKECKEYIEKQENCDHEFVDTSIAGPESGTLGYECKKCGFSNEVTLY